MCFLNFFKNSPSILTSTKFNQDWQKEWSENINSFKLKRTKWLNAISQSQPSFLAACLEGLFVAGSIKQFAVTNCSKERPGSIVTKTLKNGILIPIATSKESHFNAGFKYISFIKFSLTHQTLRAWENLRYFRK